MVDLVLKILQLNLMVVILDVHQFQSGFFGFKSLNLQSVDKLALFAKILVLFHLNPFLFDFELDLGFQVLSLDGAQ